jgi:hypothetical protein
VKSRSTTQLYPAEIQRLRSRVDGLVHRDFILPGQWLPQHDKALGNTLLVVQQLLAEKNISVSTQPPYPPDLAASDFWLFPTLKMGLKGTHFTTMEDIISNAMTELQEIPLEAFHRCFQQWQDRWIECVCVCICALVFGVV